MHWASHDCLNSLHPCRHAASPTVTKARVNGAAAAGNKGTAITFIGPEEEQYSPDLVKALSESGAPIPQASVKQGLNGQGEAWF